MDVNRRLREIRYAIRRALDLEHATSGRDPDVLMEALRALREFQELDRYLSSGGQLPEPWAEAARRWDYTSPESRERYNRVGTYDWIPEPPEPEKPTDPGPSNVVPFPDSGQPRDPH